MPKPKPAPEERPAEQPQSVVYIGPDIAGVAKSGTSYVDGLPQALEELAQKLPMLRQLLVPHSGLAAARRELANPNSVRTACLRAVAAKLSETGGET